MFISFLVCTQNSAVCSPTCTSHRSRTNPSWTLSYYATIIYILQWKKKFPKQGNESYGDSYQLIEKENELFEASYKVCKFHSFTDQCLK